MLKSILSFKFAAKNLKQTIHQFKRWVAKSVLLFFPRINSGYLLIQYLIYFHFQMPTYWWSHYAHLFEITVPTYWWPRDAHLLTVLWWRLDWLFVCVRSFSLASCLPAELFLSVDCVLRSWRTPHCTIHTNSIFCTCKHRYTTMECHT